MATSLTHSLTSTELLFYSDFDQRCSIFAERPSLELRVRGRNNTFRFGLCSPSSSIRIQTNFKALSTFKNLLKYLLVSAQQHQPSGEDISVQTTKTTTTEVLASFFKFGLAPCFSQSGYLNLRVSSRRRQRHPERLSEFGFTDLNVAAQTIFSLTSMTMVCLYLWSRGRSAWWLGAWCYLLRSGYYVLVGSRADCTPSIDTQESRNRTRLRPSRGDRTYGRPSAERQPLHYALITHS